MDNLTPDAAVNAVCQQLGLKMETNQKQVAVYVTASIVLNGFLDIFTGTVDVASVLSSINLQALSLAQIKQMTEQINKNVITLMEADGKAAWDHFKRGNFNEARDCAIRGFHAAPSITIKLMCTRIKLITELIMKDEEKTGVIIQRCLDELLYDDLVKELWKSATSWKTFNKSTSHKLIAEIDDVVGGCYATLSRCLKWTCPDNLLKDGNIATLYTKYLPSLENNKILVPISQHLETFTSMEVFKKFDKSLHLTITISDSMKGVHQRFPVSKKSVNTKPSKSSIWELKKQKNKYSLVKVSVDETSDEGETKDAGNEVDNVKGEKKEGGGICELDSEEGQKEANKLVHNEDQSSKQILAMREEIESMKYAVSQNKQQSENFKTLLMKANEEVSKKVEEIEVLKEEVKKSETKLLKKTEKEMVIAKAEGYFTNNEEFYGPNRKEFLHITFENGFWQGLKIVGDANVPRGKVSFRTTKKEVNIDNPTPAKIQVRATFFWFASSFHWMEGASVRFDSSTHKWYIMAGWLGGSFSFSRCTEQEAMNAAKGPDNA